MHILESPDSQNTASTRRERGERKRDHVVISMSIQIRRHKQLTKKRTLGVTALEQSVAKQFATGGLNQVLGCTSLTLAPKGSHINKQL